MIKNVIKFLNKTRILNPGIYEISLLYECKTCREPEWRFNNLWFTKATSLFKKNLLLIIRENNDGIVGSIDCRKGVESMI